jgi:Ricin-type beta-trefoil lectin domain-like
MSAFLSFRCLVTAKLLAAVLLAAAPIDASRAANLLINGKTGKCLTIAGGTSPANNVEAVQFDCDGDLSRSWHLNGVGDAFQIQNAKTGTAPHPLIPITKLATISTAANVKLTTNKIVISNSSAVGR